MKALWLLFLLLAHPAWGDEVKCNQAGIDLIKKYEGFRATPYVCSGGKLTIGYGHTKNVIPNMTITPEEGEKLLCQDIAETEEAISRMVKRPLSENQFAALTSLAYNIGLGNFAKSSVLALIKDGMFASVPHAIAKWRRAGGVVLGGLIKRRKAEGQLWNTPDKEV